MLPRQPEVQREPHQLVIGGRGIQTQHVLEQDLVGERLPALQEIFADAPQLAAGYSGLLKTVRLENSLRPDIRELLVCLVL